MIECPECKAENPPDSIFCGMCGTRLSTHNVRADILNRIEIYGEALLYLGTCGPFDASKYEKLDEILSKAGAASGPEKRQEMLSRFRYVLPTKTREGGLEELRAVIIETLGSAIRIFNETLVKVSPTPEKDAEEVVRILEKYKPPESNGR